MEKALYDLNQNGLSQLKEPTHVQFMKEAADAKFLQGAVCSIAPTSAINPEVQGARPSARYRRNVQKCSFNLGVVFFNI